MSELETYIKDKDSVIFSQQSRISELEADCKELMEDYQSLGAESLALREDCKVMSEVLISQHSLYRQNQKPLPCTCRACTIAAKYREGK